MFCNVFPRFPAKVFFLRFHNTNDKNTLDIPINQNKPKTKYTGMKTYLLNTITKPKVDMKKVSGISQMSKFDPQNVGLPK